MKVSLVSFKTLLIALGLNGSMTLFEHIFYIIVVYMNVGCYVLLVFLVFLIDYTVRTVFVNNASKVPTFHSSGFLSSGHF